MVITARPVTVRHQSSYDVVDYCVYITPCDIYFIAASVYMPIPISQFVPLSHFPHAHVSILYICISIPALEIGSWWLRQ